MLPVRPSANIEWGAVVPDTYEDLAVPNTAGGTPLTKLATKHVAVFISNEGQNVRYTVDGTAPVSPSGSGHLLFDTERLTLNYLQAKGFLAIADQATGSTLRVTYFRGKQ